jgi:putative copper export protein
LVLAAIAHASSGAVAATSAAQRIGLQVILIAASGAIAWRARRRPTLLVISALPAFLALVAHSTGGHGVLAPGTQGVAGHVGMTAHLVAAGLWAGGIVGLLLLLPAPVATVAEWIRRFSPLALVCAIVVALTGLQQAIDHIPSGASGGLYVRLLWLKAGLLAALLAFGGWHLWVALPHIEGRRRRWGAAHSTTTLRRSLPTDAAIMVLVLLVAGVLAAVAPPAAPPDASGPRAVNEVDGILGDYTATVALLADPVWSGQPHWLEVTLLERSSRSASLAILEAGRTDPNGTHQAIALERGASNWTAPLTFDAPGTWVVSLRLLGPTRGELLLPVRIQEMPT